MTVRNSKPEHNWVLLVLLGIIIGLLWSADGCQITSYSAWKGEDGEWIPLNRTVYKVNPAEQTIIYWAPGIYEVPNKLVNCIVRDRKNWVGEYLDGSGKVMMENGREVSDQEGIIYIGRIRWQLMEWGIGMSDSKKAKVNESEVNE